MDLQFFHLERSGHADERRSIIDVTFPGGIEIPFSIVHAKIIFLSQAAVDNGLSLGNHFHTTDSNRIEFFIAVGEEDVPLFRIRAKRGGEELVEKIMKNGDACLVPPGVTHAFLPLRAGVQLWCYSNTAYNPEHDVPDQLFD